MNLARYGPFLTRSIPLESDPNFELSYAGNISTCSTLLENPSIPGVLLGTQHVVVTPRLGTTLRNLERSSVHLPTSPETRNQGLPDAKPAELIKCIFYCQYYFRVVVRHLSFTCTYIMHDPLYFLSSYGKFS